MTSVCCSPSSARRREDQLYQWGSSVVTARITLLSTSTSAPSPRLSFTGQRHDFVGRQAGGGSTPHHTDQTRPPAGTSSDLSQDQGIPPHRELDLGIRENAELLADGARN